MTDRAMLQARAKLLAQIRDFFSAREVLEVETPVLSAASGTDPVLAPLHTRVSDKPYFLQTSPEFAMKRLLAAGSGPIYQLARAFRDGEAGSRHNAEFTMLEWYRPGFSLQALMAEVAELVASVLPIASPVLMTYSNVFRQYLGIDPLAANLAELQQLAREHTGINMQSDNRDHWLDLLFSHCIEPHLQAPCFISAYPPSQAALASLGEDELGRTVARRFELVVAGMEIANGYQELVDPVEQRQRFEHDLSVRREVGKPELPVDENLLGAMAHGLPECAGVALGVDRLLMLVTGASSIREVISFPIDRA